MSKQFNIEPIKDSEGITCGYKVVRDGSSVYGCVVDFGNGIDLNEARCQCELFIQDQNDED